VVFNAQYRCLFRLYEVLRRFAVAKTKNTLEGSRQRYRHPGVAVRRAVLSCVCVFLFLFLFCFGALLLTKHYF
jgi:hypothetical protein